MAECRFFQRGACRYGDTCRFAHIDSRVAAKGFSDREWSHAKASTSGGEPELTFTLMSYNTLADELANTHAAELYQEVPRHCINWQHRGQQILKEIAHFMPDLIALQEVDHLEAFQESLHRLGYSSVYAQRSGGRGDGCATFWNTHKYRAVQQDVVRFSEYDLRDNVAVILVVEPLVGGMSGQRPPRLVLGNIHVLFNPKRGDIKLAQVRTLASRVHQIAAQHDALAILAGDFNSTPSSSIYSFCASGALVLPSTDRRTMSGQVEDGGGRPPASPGREALTSDSAAVREYKRMGWSLEDLSRGVGNVSSLPVRDDWIARHPLQLTSAYCEVLGKEPLFTTCHSKNTATVDFQWYTARSKYLTMRPLGVLQPPTLDVIGPAKLPSIHFASDHICLLCQYAVYQTEL